MRVGADVEALDDLARRFDVQGRALDRLVTDVDREVGSAWWRGGHADDFRAFWGARARSDLRALADELVRLSGRVSVQAGQQRRASAADGLPDPASPVGWLAGRPTAASPRSTNRLTDLPGRNSSIQRRIRDDLAGVDREIAELERHIDGHGLLAPLAGVSLSKRRRELRERRDTLLGLLQPSPATGQPRQFLRYSSAPGDERIVEVIGDLGTADRVVIHIPGMNTGLDDYDNGGNPAATNLKRQLDLVSTNVVVISFMDYNVPDDLLEAAGGGGADSGVQPLQRLVGELQDLGFERDDLAVVAHSYGSVVTGHTMRAEGGLQVGRVVVVGSPGMSAGADHRADLGSPHVEVFAGSAPVSARWNPVEIVDPVSHAPGHGANPAGDGFGAAGFDTGQAYGHSAYFDQQTDSLKNIALIAAGHDPN